MAQDHKKLWDENCAEILSKRTPEKRAYEQHRIDKALKILEETPTGREIVRFIKDNKTSILFDYQADDCGGYIIPGTNTICLSATVDPVQLAIFLAHEARHIYQDKNGLIPTQFNDPVEFIIQTRMIEADALAFELKVIDELNEIGYNIKHRGLKRLQTMKQADPDYRDTHSLLWAGFYSFFVDGRKDIYDKGSAILALLSLQLNRGHTPSDIKISNSEFANNGHYTPPLSDGLNLFDKQSVQDLSLSFTSERPYLSHEHVNFITNDDTFTAEFSTASKKQLKALLREVRNHTPRLKTPIGYSL